MTQGTTNAPPRRTLLQRGLLAAASALGLASTGEAAARTPVAQRAFRGRMWPVTPSETGRTHRILRCGSLIDPASGESLGEYYASLFEAGPLPSSQGGFGLEFHTFRFPDGTLFGIGSGNPDSERTFAILGGTGRFASARGSYVERQVCASPCGRDEVDFVLNLSA